MHASPGGTREKSLLVALSVCAFDLVLTANAAWMSNSIAILGDLLKESTDTLAVLAALFTLRVVQRPTDHRFSYGIGRLENLVSILIGSLMLGSAILVSVLAAQQFVAPHRPHGTLFGIGVFALHACIGLVILTKTRRSLRQQPSALMSSQARLWAAKTLYDLTMACGLALALAFRSEAWSWYVDPAASMIGVALMLHAAWGMASSSVGDLLDASVEEATQLQIMRQMVAHIDDYERLHGVRTRRSGSNLFVEVALQFDPLWAMGDVQHRIESIRHDIGHALPGARVSICPVAGEPG